MKLKIATAGCAAACIVVSGLLAGCGSSSSPSAGATATVTVTAPAATPATSSPAAPAATPTGPPGCSTAGLSAALGTGSGAAGSTYYPIEFTNTSSSTCTLYGYPGVSFVSASGSQIGASATEDPVYPRVLVTLAPGGSAPAELQVGDAQNYPASSCSPVAVSRLKVYPPGQTAALVIAVTATACRNASVPILMVQTVQPAGSSQ